MSPPLVFLKRNGGRLGISTEALRTMQSYVQREPGSHEAGGVMIGRYVTGGEDIVVDLVTGPLPGDRRSRFRFHRSKRSHQAVLDREWQQSGHTRTYVGEWHTHPEPDPSPSTIDLNDWRRRVQRDTFHGEELHFVIVGQTQLRAWEMTRQTSPELHPLSLMHCAQSSETAHVLIELDLEQHGEKI